jgi:hypothetical protein
MPILGCLSGSSGRGAHDELELDQPLIVVVLEVFARVRPTATRVVVLINVSGQAKNMLSILIGAC